MAVFIDGEKLNAALEGLRAVPPSYAASTRFQQCLRDTSTGAATDKHINRDQAIGRLATAIACPRCRVTHATCSHTGGAWDGSKVARVELCKKILEFMATDPYMPQAVVPVNWPEELFRLEREHKPADIDTIFLGMDPCPPRTADADRQGGYAFDEHPASSPSIKNLHKYSLSPCAATNFEKFGIVQVNLNRIMRNDQPNPDPNDKPNKPFVNQRSGKGHFLVKAFEAYFKAFVENIIAARKANKSTKLHIVVCTTGAYRATDGTLVDMKWEWLTDLHKNNTIGLVMTCTTHPSRYGDHGLEEPILPVYFKLRKSDGSSLVDDLPEHTKCKQILSDTSKAAAEAASTAYELYEANFPGTLPYALPKFALGIQYLKDEAKKAKKEEDLAKAAEEEAAEEAATSSALAEEAAQAEKHSATPRKKRKPADKT